MGRRNLTERAKKLARINSKLWRETNPERSRLIRYRFNQSVKGRYYTYKDTAKRRNNEFPLSLKQFAQFWQKSCYYCGRDIKTIGLDRVDNNIGYSIQNLVSCCIDCNRAKRTLSQKEFITLCRLVASKHEPIVAEI